ncbi:vomeronasal type-2 receptor 116-like isoform X2 [Onychomys torridus]|uniref:vomeronasal type-2 receptor 116-like isoform X2 n=1 Tax=Onychomys torridus TaxID=38674 RepID=UPI00167F96C6|nr:vomeronasal type-2 receptor 116-like isoform X2 [Onychomys torridus]
MINMFSLTFVFLVLMLSSLFCSLTDPKCFLRIKDKENQDGDKELDCFFSIYTKSGHMKNDHFSGNLDKQLTTKNVHMILSLYFAIEEINGNPHILPNISLLVKIECKLLSDRGKISLSSKRGDYFPNYHCRNQRRYLVILTGPMWLPSAMLGPLLYVSRIPELYYGPFHPLLSNHEHFPYLYQMGIKDTSVAVAMVSLVIYFSWKWVGLIISDDDLGLQFASELREEMQRSGICLAFVTIITYDIKLFFRSIYVYYNQIMMSTAKVVVIYGDKDSHLQVNLRLWQFVNIQRIWVTTSQWDMITSNGEFLFNSLHGTLSFSHHYSEIAGLKKFIQTVNPSNYTNTISLAKLWWLYFNCSLSSSNCKKLKNCSEKMLPEWLSMYQFEMSMSDTSYNLYNAVYAVAHSLHKLLLQQVDIWSKNTGKGLEFDSLQIFPFLKNIQFVNPAGDLVNMNQKANLDTEYDIFYTGNFLQNFGLKVKIGKFSQYFAHPQQLLMSDAMIKWATDIRQIPPSICSTPCSPGFRKSLQDGQGVCCFDCTRCPENEISNMTDMDYCLKCPDDQYANTEGTHCLSKIVTFLSYEDPTGMALACLALCFSAFAAVTFGVFLRYQDTPIVKANNRVLSYCLLLSLIFCFLCSLLFIGQPHRAMCIMQQTIFAVVFTVAVSTVLAKTITVVLAFKVTVPGKMMRWLLISGATNLIIPTCTMIQLILCGIWVGTSPPFVDTDGHIEHGHILIVCNKGSVMAFYSVLGYLGSIALASFTVAFFARNLPDTFNEAKFLTFSMLVFCSVWITFLPVYHSTKGKAMAIVEVFCILTSSAGLLLCIFAPKCYIILLKPERNSFHKFRDTHAKV